MEVARIDAHSTSSGLGTTPRTRSIGIMSEARALQAVTSGGTRMPIEIVSDPTVMMGKPVVASTRVTKDFGELVFRQRRLTAGVVVLRRTPPRSERGGPRSSPRAIQCDRKSTSYACIGHVPCSFRCPTHRASA